MATVTLEFDAATGSKVPGTDMPELKSAGSTLGMLSYGFDATTSEALQWKIPRLVTYGSGSWTVKVRWFADTATVNDCVWEASVAAITIGTDTTDFEAKTWDTGVNGASTAHGTAQAGVEKSITLTTGDIDGAVTGDIVWLKIARLPANGSDTMAGDAQLVGVVLEYSDT